MARASWRAVFTLFLRLAVIGLVFGCLPALALAYLQFALVIGTLALLGGVLRLLMEGCEK